MDTQTRHALKQDGFAQATASSFSWLSDHSSSVVRWVIGSAVILVLVLGSLIFWNMRSGAADRALGAALDTYVAPLAPGGSSSTPMLGSSLPWLSHGPTCAC